MAAKKQVTKTDNAEPTSAPLTELRAPAEVRYRKQLQALIAADRDPKPTGWRLSPRAVLRYVVGDKTLETFDGEQIEITRKFFGDDTIVQRAIVTLASERALLLIGDPGTGK